MNSQLACTHFLEHRYETSAAIIETETSTAELAEEVRNRATQARVAAKEAALIAEVSQPHRSLISSVSKLTTGPCHDVFSLFPQAQPHLPSGAVQAGDTTTAARAEAQQTSPEAAQQVHATAEHTKGVAEHAASTAHVRPNLNYLLSRLFCFFLVEEVSHSHTLPWAHTRLRDPASPAMSMTL